MQMIIKYKLFLERMPKMLLTADEEERKIIFALENHYWKKISKPREVRWSGRQKMKLK